MAEKENYVIRVEGNVVEVSPEVYYAYFHMERQERGQEEKKQRNAVVSYAYDRFSWMEDELFRQIIGEAGMNFGGRIPWRI